MNIAKSHSLAADTCIAVIKRYAYTVLIPLLLASTPGNAQYATVALTGYNQDIIANGPVLATSVTTYADGVIYFLLDSSFTAFGAPTYALPVSGTLHSILTPGLSFQLASASSSNTLQLKATNPSGAIRFVTPRTADTIYVLAMSGYNTTTDSMTVKFTDSSFQAFPGQSIYDWYSVPNPAVKGFGRTSSSGQDPDPSTGTNNPRLQQIPLAISPANKSKSIAYILFTRIPGSNPINDQLSVCDIMAISVLPVTTTLPITLANFQGQKQGSNNLLSWSTITEINNKGFELQRSADGNTFSTLSFITSEAVNGNSSTVLNYQSIDAQPLSTDNYYRLQQVNKDGSTVYSNTAFVKGAETNGISVTVYPNPVTDKLTIAIHSKETSKVSLVISSTDGKVIIAQNVQLIAGANTLPINASQLARGTYAVKIMAADGNTVYTSLFVK